jgi:hypothetical protein
VLLVDQLTRNTKFEGSNPAIVFGFSTKMRIMRFLYEMNTGKSQRGIRQEGGREKDLGKEGEQHSGERELCGLILTVGINQQHL